MAAGGKLFSGLKPLGPRPQASMPGPWRTITQQGYQVPNPDPGKAAYEAWKGRIGGLVPYNDINPWTGNPHREEYASAGKPTISAPKYRFDQGALTKAQVHHDRMAALREKKLEALAGLSEYGQKDLGHFKQGAQQLNVGPQGRAEFKILPMMEERSYVSLEDPTVENIDQYERKRRRVV